MKECTKCGSTKSVEEFAANSKMKDGRQVWCRACQKERAAVYYKENSLRQVARNTAHRRRLRQEAFDFLLANPCVDCGESDPIVLDFDHVSGEKNFSIGEAAGSSISLSKLRAEMAKCVVRCSNCHRRKTARDFGWYADLRDSSSIGRASNS